MSYFWHVVINAVLVHRSYVGIDRDWIGALGEGWYPHGFLDAMANKQRSFPGVFEDQLQVDGRKECRGLFSEPQKIVIPLLLNIRTLSSEAHHVLVVVIVIAVRIQVVTPKSFWPQFLPNLDGSDKIPLGCSFKHNLCPFLCLIFRKWSVLLFDLFDWNLSVDIFASPVSNPLRSPLFKVKHSQARSIGGMDLAIPPAASSWWSCMSIICGKPSSCISPVSLSI